MGIWSRRFLKAQWDALVAIAYALVVTGLTLLGDISEQHVATWTLGMLALVALTIVKDRQGRASTEDQAVDVRASLATIERQLSLSNELEAVAPGAISTRFAEGMHATTRWRFKGGTGTYLRAQTLPNLAFGGHKSVEVWAEILAPDQADVCASYGQHRRQRSHLASPDGGGERWSTRDVRIEAYATIVAAVWYSEHTSVRVHVALTSVMSTIRHDMCDSFVLVTNESPSSRALAMVNTPSGSFFDSAKRELEISFDQARQLGLRRLSLPRDDITADDVRRVLRQVERLTDDDEFLTPTVCDEIALKAISQQHAAHLGVKRGGAIDPYPPDR